MLGFRKRVLAGDLNPLDMAWSMIEADTPEGPLSIRRNHALPQLADPARHDKMLVIDAPFAHADAAGRPEEAEFARLNRIEDLLIHSLGADALAVVALVITKPHARRFVFYTADAHAVTPLVEAIEAEVGGPEMSGNVGPDPGWTQYRAFMKLR